MSENEGQAVMVSRAPLWLLMGLVAVSGGFWDFGAQQLRNASF